jgi:hypothetical protein
MDLPRMSCRACLAAHVLRRVGDHLGATTAKPGLRGVLANGLAASAAA